MSKLYLYVTNISLHEIHDSHDFFKYKDEEG